MVVWRWACICIRSMGSLILVLPLPLRWAVKSVALLIRVHPTGVSSSSCMDQAAMLCQVPLVAIARKGSANGDKTPVGERQVAVVAALPMSSRFAAVSPRSRGDHRVAEGRALPPRIPAAPRICALMAVWLCLSTLPLCAGWRMC
jgi:hypothetical protein